MGKYSDFRFPDRTGWPHDFQLTDSFSECDIIATLPMRISQKVSKADKVENKTVMASSNEAWVAMFFGKRLVTIDFFSVSGHLSAQSVKYKAVWETERWGIHTSDEFQSKHGGYAELLRRYINHPDSKWTEMTLPQLAMWKTRKTNKWSVIGNLGGFDNFVEAVRQLDKVHSDSILSQVSPSATGTRLGSTPSL